MPSEREEHCVTQIRFDSFNLPSWSISLFRVSGPKELTA